MNNDNPTLEEQSPDPFELAPVELQEVSRMVHEGDNVYRTVRELLSWFYARRRGNSVNAVIQMALDEVNLTTDPYFEYAYIDQPIEFIKLDEYLKKAEEMAEENYGNNDNSTLLEPNPDHNSIAFISGSVDDPTFRIGQLKAAVTPLVLVRPTASISEATTIMLMNDFSQLPVMQNDREIKGVISWESIGRSVSLKHKADTVNDCMDTIIPEARADSSLLSSIDIIVKYGYVFVRQKDNKYSGIVTTNDLSLQFRQLAEPFLLIGEIENYIRRLIDGKFTTEQLQLLKEPNDSRDINKVSDLSFGQYVRLLENPDLWTNLKIAIDRSVFIRQLDRVRELRNEIMHFEPDPFGEEEIDTLRSFANFMRILRV